MFEAGAAGSRIGLELLALGIESVPIDSMQVSTSALLFFNRCNQHESGTKRLPSFIYLAPGDFWLSFLNVRMAYTWAAFLQLKMAR